MIQMSGGEGEAPNLRRQGHFSKLSFYNLIEVATPSRRICCKALLKIINAFTRATARAIASLARPVRRILDGEGEVFPVFGVKATEHRHFPTLPFFLGLLEASKD